MSMLGYDTSLNYLLAGQPDLGHPLLAVLLLDLYFVQVSDWTDRLEAESSLHTRQHTDVQLGQGSIILLIR